MIKKAIALKVLLISTITLSAQLDTAYSFFVAGHSYGQPGVNNKGLHPPFKGKFDYIKSNNKIEFGVLVGDIVSANPIEQDWIEVDLDLDTLGLPTYFAVGNHDMENRPVFESRYGDTYKAFINRGDLFIILDPNLDGWNISGNQLTFLKSTLNTHAAEVQNIFVFFHQLLWQEKDNEFNYIRGNSDAGRGENINFWTTVAPLFSNLKNETTFFAGDIGVSWASNVTYDKIGNLTFIATGMGDNDQDNFIIANVRADKTIEFEVVCLDELEINCLGELIDLAVVENLPLATNSRLETTLLTYPNPANNRINFSNNSSLINIQMFNTINEIIFNQNTTENYIDVSNIADGIYILKTNKNGIHNSSKINILR